MINHIGDRGGSAAGLIRYLAGPGRANEHIDQRVITAAPALGIGDGTRLDPVVDRKQIAELGRQLDSHRKLYGVQVTGGHMWHCSISLPRGEQLSDAQWAHVARVAIAEMGFDDEASGRAPCRACRRSGARSASRSITSVT